MPSLVGSEMCIRDRDWNSNDFVSDWSDTAKEDGTSNQKRMFEIVTFFDNKAIPMDGHTFDDMVHRLGNLTLLTPKPNIVISNLPFLEKKYHYNTKTEDSDLKVKGCNLDGDSTASPPISPCPYYSDTGISQVEYTNPFGIIVPVGIKTRCSQHDSPDGYNASELSINSNTVMRNESTLSDRGNWTALSIMERTRHFVDLTYSLWRLPKIYCTNSNCIKYNTPIKDVRGDLNETTSSDEKDRFIGNKKCTEKINGQLCDHELEVFWPVNGISPDLDVPTGNWKLNSARMQNP